MSVKESIRTKEWEVIRTSLLPAKREPKPKKWMGLASAELELHDGRPFHIEIYQTPDAEPAAFCVGRNSQDRNYYRGGDKTALLKALHEIRAKTEESP